MQMRLKSSPESGKELRNRMVWFALILGKDPIVIVIVINLISKINNNSRIKYDNNNILFVNDLPLEDLEGERDLYRWEEGIS